MITYCSGCGHRVPDPARRPDRFLCPKCSPLPRPCGRQGDAMSDVRKLIDEAREGSADAFCGLVKLYQARVRTYIARFIRDQNVVDDLAQNTFLSGFRRLESYRGDAALGTWLLAIARNEALMYLREERVRRDREGSALTSALSR